MALQKPVAVYDAANDTEAQRISNLLNDAGIEAYFTEDAQVGQFPVPKNRRYGLIAGLSTVRGRYCRTTNTASSDNGRPKQTKTSYEAVTVYDGNVCRPSRRLAFQWSILHLGKAF